MNFDAEWLESDGRGGFASGTVGGARTRRYHALLLPATQPPVARMVLVNGIEAWLKTPGGEFPLSTHRYACDAGAVIYPDGQNYIAEFDSNPWPRWTFVFPGDVRITQELFIDRAGGATIVCWTLAAPCQATLEVRPLLSGRDYHALHRENAGFNFQTAKPAEGCVKWQPYPGVPQVSAYHNGVYRQDPLWFRNFLYTAERERGLDYIEDLASPGTFTFDLGGQPFASLAFGTGTAPSIEECRRAESARRAAFPDTLRRSGDAYIVRGLRGTTILAGYPWFTDWGRDTFISLRGLCLAAGRLDDARDILLQWSGAVSRGMLPNRFPDGGEAPEYNTVDAALWFVIAAHEYLASRPADPREQQTLRAACEAILEGYAAGTRYGIRLDPQDGLIAAGEPGLALTWMDARVDGRAITPRIGKPVEIQALWINALSLCAVWQPRWATLRDQALASFEQKFWNAGRNCLFDVIDVNGVPGQNDPLLRPNQLFALGGLPMTLISDPARARAIVDLAERQLLTPIGLRRLAPGEPGYTPYYNGSPHDRDSAYHQGTVWPWLIGPFVEAWVRVRGSGDAVRKEARERFVAPLLDLLPHAAGLDHLPEIADAEAPHWPKGCPFQAWSLGELTRLGSEL